MNNQKKKQSTFAESIAIANDVQSLRVENLNSQWESALYTQEGEDEPRPVKEEDLALWAQMRLFKSQGILFTDDAPEVAQFIHHQASSERQIGKHAFLTAGVGVVNELGYAQIHHDHEITDQECYGVKYSWDKNQEDNNDGFDLFDTHSFKVFKEKVCDGVKMTGELSRKEVYNISFRHFNDGLIRRGMGLSELWLNALEGASVKCVRFEAWGEEVNESVAACILPIEVSFSSTEEFLFPKKVQDYLDANEVKAEMLDEAEKSGTRVLIGARNNTHFVFEREMSPENAFLYVGRPVVELDMYQYRHMQDTSDAIMCGAVTVTETHIVLVEFGSLPRVLKVSRRGTLSVFRKLGLRTKDLIENSSVVLDKPVFIRGLAGPVFELEDGAKMRTLKTIQVLTEQVKRKAYVI